MKAEAIESSPEPTPNPNVTTKVYKYFDLETFESKEKSVDVNFVPPTSLAEATAAVGNDESILLKAVTDFLRAKAYSEAERSVISLGGRKSVVMDVIKPFRSMGPWNKMFVLGADGKPVKETYTIKRGDRKGQTVTEDKIDRPAQTRAILTMIKSNPQMLESIKNASLEATNETDENDGDDQS